MAEDRHLESKNQNYENHIDDEDYDVKEEREPTKASLRRLEHQEKMKELLDLADMAFLLADFFGNEKRRKEVVTDVKSRRKYTYEDSKKIKAAVFAGIKELGSKKKKTDKSKIDVDGKLIKGSDSHINNIYVVNGLLKMLQTKEHVEGFTGTWILPVVLTNKLISALSLGDRYKPGMVYELMDSFPKMKQGYSAPMTLKGFIQIYSKIHNKDSVFEVKITTPQVVNKYLGNDAPGYGAVWKFVDGKKVKVSPSEKLSIFESAYNSWKSKDKEKSAFYKDKNGIAGFDSIKLSILLNVIYKSAYTKKELADAGMKTELENLKNYAKEEIYDEGKLFTLVSGILRKGEDVEGEQENVVHERPERVKLIKYKTEEEKNEVLTQLPEQTTPNPPLSEQSKDISEEPFMEQQQYQQQQPSRKQLPRPGKTK